MSLMKQRQRCFCVNKEPFLSWADSVAEISGVHRLTFAVDQDDGVVLVVRDDIHKASKKLKHRKLKENGRINVRHLPCP